MTRCIAVVSGKGGVGKTSSTVNLAQALSALGKRTVVLDANLVTPNVALHLGLLEPKSTVNHFLQRKKGMKDIIHEHEDCGVSFIPASSSFREFRNTDYAKLGKVFEQLKGTVDFVLVDAPSGLGEDLLHILEHTDEVLAVVTPTNTSVMEALKSIELAKLKNNTVAGALLNMSSMWPSHELSSREVADILGVQVLANVRYDRKMKKSLHKQLPLQHLYPWSRSAKQFTQVAQFLALEHRD